MKKLNILITGASKGIGLATAKILAKKGHRVAMFDIDTDTLESVLQDKVFKPAIEAGAIVQGYLDVTIPENWDSAITTMLEKFGSIDVLINNAGIIVGGKLCNTNLEAQLSLVDINCKGVLIGCYKVTAVMTGSNSTQNYKQNHNQNCRKIINVSSASAVYGQPEIAPYSASKFFVRGLTEGLNLEFAAQDIRVVDVMPLWVKTNLTDGIKVGSIERLGLNLNANDVGKAIAKLSVSKNKKLTKTHYPVGVPAKVLNALAQITPSRVNRYLTHKISG